MNHIGSIIQEFRLLKNLTRNDLAKDICTEKYIYLIEKGERTPSTNLLRKMSDRLKVDLFEYYKFLDCIDPVKVRDIIDGLTLCQQKSDFLETAKIILIAEQTPDFKRKPWLHILEANRIACQIFIEKKYKESIRAINSALEKVHDDHLGSIFVLSLYVLLSTCYQILGQSEDARNLAVKINDIIKKQYNDKTHDHMIISGRINLLTFYYHSQEFARVIRLGKELIDFQEKANSLARIHYAFAFSAFAYYKTKNYNEAFLYLNKTIFSLLTYYNPNDAHYIMSIGAFKSMAKDKRINQDVISLFFAKYKDRI